MEFNSLRDLYIEQLKDLYDAENQIMKALPELIDAATSTGLKQALSSHLEVTKTQANRIEQIFGAMGEEVKSEKCKGMKGVIDEGSDLVDDIDENEMLRDAAIIASAQRVEHYEMAGYGTARTYAQLLGENQAAQLLEQTLNEEKQADQELTELAQKINVAAGGTARGVVSQGRSQRKIA